MNKFRLTPLDGANAACHALNSRQLHGTLTALITVAGPDVWNTLSEDISKFQSVSTFYQRPKTWFIISGHRLNQHITFNLLLDLEVALLLRQLWLI